MFEPENGAFRHHLDGEELVHLDLAVLYVSVHADHAIPGRLTPMLVNHTAVVLPAVMPRDESQIRELGVGDRGFGFGRRRWRGAERPEHQAEAENHDSGVRIHIDWNLLLDFENGTYFTVVPTNNSIALEK